MGIIKKTALALFAISAIGCAQLQNTIQTDQEETPTPKTESVNEMSYIRVGRSNDNEFTTLDKLWGKTKEEIKELIDYEILEETNNQLIFIGSANDVYSMWSYIFDHEDKLIHYSQIVDESDLVAEDALSSFFATSEKAAEYLKKEPNRTIYPHSRDSEAKYHNNYELWAEGLMKNDIHFQHVFNMNGFDVLLTIVSDHPDYTADMAYHLDYILTYTVTENKPRTNSAPNMCRIK